MKTTGIHNGFAFTDNPVIITWESGEQAVGTFEIYCEGQRVFTGRFFEKLHVDISDIIKTTIGYFEDVPESAGAVTLVHSAEEMEFNRIRVVAECNGMDDECDFIAVRGGISLRRFRLLAMRNTDIFGIRFLNNHTGRNPFFTTRSENVVFDVKETELAPLYFINTELNTKLSATNGRESVELGVINSGIYAIDINAIRQLFFSGYGLLSNTFSIFKNDTCISTINIIAVAPSLESYRVKFRNSLGVFEILDLQGELSIIIPAKKEDPYYIYDVFTGTYSAHQERESKELSLSIPVIVKTPEDFALIQEMTSSDEVYLLGLSGDAVRILPIPEEITYKKAFTEPLPAELKFIVSDAENTFYHYSLEDLRRVFSKEFSTQFA